MNGATDIVLTLLKNLVEALHWPIGLDTETLRSFLSNPVKIFQNVAS